jgi:hypothetical protein
MPAMLCQETNHRWLGAFAVRLMQLRDDMALPEAVRRAVLAHAHASAMPPEEAAAIESRVLTRRASRAPVQYRANAMARVNAPTSLWGAGRR